MALAECSLLILNCYSSTGTGLTTDQRGAGFARVADASFATNADDGSDIGAFEAQVTELVVADLSVTKDDDADVVAQGGNITYTITLTNNSTGAVQQPTLSDALPANTTFVSLTSPAGFTSTAPAVGATGTITSSATTLAAGASAVFTLVVKVDPTTPAATVISNTATASSFSGDPNPANNSDTETTSVALPSLSIEDATVVEGDTGVTSAIFNVRLSTSSGQAVSVNFAAVDGTATGGAAGDYQVSTGTRTFNPGETLKTITVLINGDTLDEADETFQVILTDPTNATLTDDRAIGTITDDDGAPTISINNAAATEGNSGTTNATFTVSLSAVSGQIVTANFATANGSATAPADYQSTSGQLSFAPGETSKTIIVAVAGDVLSEGAETFAVNLSGATNATLGAASGTGTITDNDAAALTLSINQSTLSENGGTATGTVTRNIATSAALAVTLLSSDTTEVTVPATVTIPIGQTSATFPLTAIDDDIVDGTQTVAIVAGASGLSDAQAIVTVIDDDVPSPLAVTFTAPRANAIVSDLPLILGTAGADDGRLKRVDIAIFSRAAGFFNGSAFQGPAILLPATVDDNRFRLSTGLTGERVIEGEYVIAARVTDTSDQVRETSITIFVDRFAPTVAITFPAANATVTNLNAVVGRALDGRRGSGVVGVDLFIERTSDRTFFNGTSFVNPVGNNVTLSTDFTRSTGRFVRRAGMPGLSQLTPGRYVITARAVDRAGRTTRAVINVTIGSVVTS